MTQTSIPTPEMLKVFETVPSKYLILSPDLFILTASDAYLAASFKSREEIVGKPLFKIYPEKPGEDGVGKAMASLQEVLATRKPHQMDIIRYDLPVSTGEWMERYWHTDHTPVLDEQGTLQYIIHHTSDVTEQVKNQAQLRVLEQQREQHQTDLEAQRNLLHNLMEEAPVAIAVYQGPRYVIELANPTVCALWGRSAQQAINTPLFELLPEVAGQGFEELLDGVMATGQPFIAHEMPCFIDRYGRRDTVYWNFVYQPLHDEQGDITRVMVVATEVTEQVTARQQLQALNEELGSTNEELSAANEEIKASNEELLGAKQALEQITSQLEERVIQRTQELTLAQQEAQRQRLILERLFMQAPAAICILDGPDLVYELVNPDYQALFPGRQLLGRRILEALPEIADHAVYATFRHVYQTGITHAEQGILIPVARPEDGKMEDRYFNYIQQARYNEAGNIDGVLVFVFEVTQQVVARKQAEFSEQQAQALAQELAAANEEIKASNEELAEANGQLIRTNVDLDNFIYTASHDLKAPISNIEALLTALLRTLSPESLASEKVERITALMQDSVERFKKTIASLTEVVKLQKENSPQEVAVALSEVIREVSLDLEPLIRSANARLEVANCPLIRFSEKNLRSVVYNLLSNAIKYRSPDRIAAILIRCEVTPEYHILSVEDNGLGMASDRLSQLFTMFKRFHDHVEGSGIGLYMVKKMVENAGGKIEVESRLGMGSTFRVYFRG